jgi:hypothetical protein
VNVGLLQVDQEEQRQSERGHGDEHGGKLEQRGDDERDHQQA